MTNLVNGDATTAEKAGGGPSDPCLSSSSVKEPCPSPSKIKTSEASCLSVFEKVKLTGEAITVKEEEALQCATFSNWPYSDDRLLIFMKSMFDKMGFSSKFSIEPSTLENFLFDVYRWYNQVPFHNFKHCFMVTQMTYALIWMNNLQDIFTDLELLSLLTASICHDLDHPGLSNFYQKSAKTVLAVRYCDQSPLENHHISKTFQLLSRPQNNIFKNLTEEEQLLVRESMVRLILATDMARHFEIVEEFNQISGKFDFGNSSHRELLLRILIKTADISNEARPFSTAERWIDCLLTEFFQEAELEKTLGIEPLPNMDPDKVQKPQSQCNFIGKMILPMYEILASILPSVQSGLVSPCTKQLNYYALQLRSSTAHEVAASTDQNTKQNSL